tara:strand:- start:178 stop:348 length:171 start_codon:yes stop_codon:yes gene_type:complete
MGLEEIIPALFLLLVLILLLPSFLSLNSKLRLFIKNLFIWSIIVASIVVISYLVLK